MAKSSNEQTSFCASSFSGDQQTVVYRCPVCFDVILIPVVLPCAHEVCKSCFDLCLENGILNCPVCRYRISSWARKCKRNSNVVDQNRMKEIQRHEVDDTYSNYDSEEVVRTLYQPGELHAEYLTELQKVLEEENDRQNVDRARALKLQQQDMEEWMEMEKQAKHDRELAIKLSEEINGGNVQISPLTGDSSQRSCGRKNGSCLSSLRGTPKSSHRRSPLGPLKVAKQTPKQKIKPTPLSKKENAVCSPPGSRQLQLLFSKETERLKDEDYRLALSVRNHLKKHQKSMKSCNLLEYFSS